MALAWQEGSDKLFWLLGQEVLRVLICGLQSLRLGLVIALSRLFLIKLLMITPLILEN
jgi:hypothetical protein